MTSRLLCLLLIVFCFSSEANATEARRTFKLPSKYIALNMLPTSTLMEKGHHYIFDTHQMDSALVCYTVVAGRWEEKLSDEDKHHVAMANNNLGYLYTNVYEDYQKAYANLQTCIEISEDWDDKEALAFALLNMGNLYAIYGLEYSSADMSEKAMDLYRRSMHLGAEIKDWEITLIAFIDMMGSDLGKKHLIGKKEDIDFFMNLKIPEDYPMKKYVRQIAQGWNFIADKDYVKAKQVFIEQLKYIDSPLEDKVYKLQTYYYLAMCSELLNDSAGEIDYLEKALSLSREMTDLQRITTALESLSNAYKEKGFTDKAEKYHDEYLEMRDSLYRSRGVNSIRDMHFLYEIKGLDEERQELELKNKQREMLIAVISVIALAIAFGMVMVYRNNRMLKERNRALYEKMQASLTQSGLKYVNSALSDKGKEELLQKINQVIFSNEVFSPDFGLDRLVEMIGSNNSYVSQVVNESYSMTLASLLAEIRIKEACKRLVDKENYGNLSLEGISQSVGFKSRSGFSSAFKRVTGISPSEYLKQAEIAGKIV